MLSRTFTADIEWYLQNNEQQRDIVLLLSLNLRKLKAFYKIFSQNNTLALPYIYMFRTVWHKCIYIIILDYYKGKKMGRQKIPI